MDITRTINEQKVFLRALEGIPLMIAAIILIAFTTYILKESW
jgi:hypothetical protein